MTKQRLGGRRVPLAPCGQERDTVGTEQQRHIHGAGDPEIQQERGCAGVRGSAERPGWNWDGEQRGAVCQRGCSSLTCTSMILSPGRGNDSHRGWETARCDDTGEGEEISSRDGDLTGRSGKANGEAEGIMLGGGRAGKSWGEGREVLGTALLPLLEWSHCSSSARGSF